MISEGHSVRHAGRGLLAPAPAPASGVVYFTQPSLPYAFSAQEPYIDTLTMTLCACR
jgi:hypothetical protein